MSYFKGKLDAGRSRAHYIDGFFISVRAGYKLLQNSGKALLADGIQIKNIGLIH